MTWARMEYYQTLFDPGEGVCFSADPYGTSVSNVDDWRSRQDCNFVCINPLALGADAAPSRPQHSKFIGRRADINVTSFRNILCEFDKGAISEQEKFISEVGLPFSTLVFSGGKSLHAVISLARPAATRDEYAALVRRVYAKLPGVDISASNPSRFTRAPGALRAGQRQELLEVRSRISADALDAWLGPAPAPQPKPPQLAHGVLKASTNAFLLLGSPEGGWNNALFRAAADMHRNGYSEQEIIDRCFRPTGYLDARDLRTINSACRASKAG